MKKILTLFVVLFGVSLFVFADAKSRKSIDDFMKEYETFVIKAEKAAETNKLSDLTNLSMESLKLAEKAEAAQTATDWTLKDSQKYLELTNRYSVAINKLSGTTNTAVENTDAATADLLKAYGY
jgi:DNA-binding ferritin-like protein